MSTPVKIKSYDVTKIKFFCDDEYFHDFFSTCSYNDPDINQIKVSNLDNCESILQSDIKIFEYELDKFKSFIYREAVYDYWIVICQLVDDTYVFFKSYYDGLACNDSNPIFYYTEIYYCKDFQMLLNKTLDIININMDKELVELKNEVALVGIISCSIENADDKDVPFFEYIINEERYRNKILRNINNYFNSDIRPRSYIISNNETLEYLMRKNIYVPNLGEDTKHTFSSHKEKYNFVIQTKEKIKLEYDEIQTIFNIMSLFLIPDLCKTTLSYNTDLNVKNCK
jgi:hypothetical protein